MSSAALQFDVQMSEYYKYSDRDRGLLFMVTAHASHVEVNQIYKGKAKQASCVVV